MKDKWIKYKAKIIISVMAAVVLTGAFFWGGNYPKAKDSAQPVTAVIETKNNEAEAIPSENMNTDKLAKEERTSAESATSLKPANSNATKLVKKDDAGSSESQSMKIDPKTGQDQYKTNPVPSGKPCSN